VSAAHSPTLRQLSERWKITIVLGVIFVAVGIVAIVAGSMAVSGGLAILLGILVAVNLPSSASWAIGLLVGLDFLCFGWVLIVLANAARKHRSAD
jgi:uncharacterized membrane protein HdeD (DUF308 family)